MATEKAIQDRIKGMTSGAISYKFVEADKKTPRDMTGYDAKCQFRREVENGNLTADLSIGNGMTWVDIAQGHLQIDKVLNLDWSPGNYVFDVKIAKAGEDFQIVAREIMKVNNKVTKS
jgi:hypothetical protein